MPDRVFPRPRVLAALAASLIALISVACGSGGGSDPAPLGDAAPAATGDAPRDPATGSQPDADASRPDADPTSTPPPPGPFWRASSDEGGLAAATLDEAAIDADGSVTIRPGGGHAGTDPQPSGYHGGSFYNGGSYRFGSVTTPVITPAAAFDSVTPSFEALTPPGTWIHVKVAARVAGTWTKDYSLGVWASDEGTVKRHSVDGQGDARGDVQTDTLVLTAPADALRITAVLFGAGPTDTPHLRALASIATKASAAPSSLAPDKTVWGKILDVPKRSQMIYPGGGEVWCSPTSTSMLEAFWAAKTSDTALVETPPTAASHCYDVTYGGTGNWPFNTAHAASMHDGKLHGFVTRLSSFAEVERLIGAGIPIAISVAYDAGQLDHSPIPSTAGHLIVVRGFAANGNVVCNDPAFPNDASVEVTYARDQLTTAWTKSMRTAYIVWPAGTKLPVDPLGAFR